MYDKYKELFLLTDEVINCYNELLSLSLIDEDSVDSYFMLFEKLENLIKEEYEYYSKFKKEDLIYCLKKISNMNEFDLGLVDMRIGFRLSCVYDRIMNNTLNLRDLFPQFNTDMELGMVDIINSKMVIDTYKLINNKLNSLVCYDDKTYEYADRLGKLNMQNAYYKISMYEMSEFLGLIPLYDLVSILSIDLKLISDKYYEKFGKNMDINEIVGNRFYTTAICLIDRLKNNKLNASSLVSIYDNLFLVSQLEILFDYLSMNELFKISMHFDEVNISSKLISNNVKSLIRGQFDKRRK